MRTTFCASVFAVALLGFGVGPAFADVLTLAATGTIKSGADLGGIFGSVGADMTGDPFTIVYTIDTNLAHSIDSPPIQYGVTGGGSYPLNTPAFHADVTVNGQVLSGAFNAGQSSIYCASCYAIFVSYNNGGSTEDRLVVTDPYFSISTYIVGAMPLTITMPFSYSLNPSTDSSSGDIYQAYGSYTDLTLNVSNITLTNDTVSAVPGPVVGGAPEPSTWAMMLIGFAGIGFAAYRRNRKSSVRKN